MAGSGLGSGAWMESHVLGSRNLPPALTLGSPGRGCPDEGRWFFKGPSFSLKDDVFLTGSRGTSGAHWPGWGAGEYQDPCLVQETEVRTRGASQ